MKKWCLLLGSLFLVSALSAKTQVPVLQKTPSARASLATNGKGGAAFPAETTASVSPLDAPFSPRYTYPGTSVSKNVVPLFMVGLPDSNGQTSTGICSAFRFHKNWIVTAAHCIDDVAGAPFNTSIYTKINKQKNGIYEIVLAPTNADHPANAQVYFYKPGLRHQGNSKAGHAYDVALVRLNEKDPALSRSSQKLQETAQHLSGLPLLQDTAAETLSALQQKLATERKSRSDFFKEPLDQYRFYIMNPIQTAELKNREATAVRFRTAYSKEEDRHRQLPDAHTWRFKGLRGGSNHTLGWMFHDTRNDPVANSGSPVLIGGFVVSVSSGPGENTYEERESPLYSESFRQFLVNSMGAEYSKGLCVQPASDTPLPVYKPTN